MTATPIFDALWIEHTIATLTADYWQSTPCPRCGAAGSDPCRKPSGRATARHEGRA
jgi:hypothetical protein